DPEGRGYGRANALVFAGMMEVSRALQHRALHTGDALRQALSAADRALLPADCARVICQGAAGAFSHEAAEALFPGSSPAFVGRWEDVIAAVKAGDADYGILPVENSSAGSVHDVYDLIIQNRCHIASAVSLPVTQCLLTLPGAELSQITRVVSHPQALAQCRDFIHAEGFEEQIAANTALAAKQVAEIGDPTLAAIASRHAAATYGLAVAKADIQTFSGNRTRFVAISNNLCLPPAANRITLLFCLPHVTGSLYHILARFAVDGLNLTKIESRPKPGGEFEYAFYLDFEGDLHNEQTVNLLCALSDELPQFSLLGSYRETVCDR
ncbi:MAG: bifunctional chorismate mutase/prephenate dehydratase, partial [Clostridia bacterium]|nr:bifunctional chorismate mutase/prephenate dehydratase [Clostridia bacterium]